MGNAFGSERHLDRFTGAGHDKGRSTPVLAVWYVIQHLVFAPFWCPSGLRATILRWFGASVGTNVLIRRGVRVHLPWKLTVGSHVWIGEGAWFLNLEPITIGNHVCISQEALLCTGSHDPDSPTMEFDNGPITVEDHAWIGARALVLRGVTVGRGSVVGAGALVVKDVPGGSTVLAPPAREV